jgi:hypothetical protein
MTWPPGTELARPRSRPDLDPTSLPDSSPFFSHHERNALSYGSKKQRLGAESYRKFDACMLCSECRRDAKLRPQTVS